VDVVFWLESWLALTIFTDTVGLVLFPLVLLPTVFPIVLFPSVPFVEAVVVCGD
jgi:hypothetical protein